MPSTTFDDTHALVEQVIAQLAEQIGGFAELFGEDVARAVERGLDVGDAFFGVHVGGGFGLRVEQRIAEQRVGERLQAGFAGDLRARAALRLIREIQVFQHLLAVGAFDRGAQLVGELALFVDARDDRGAPVFQFAQIQQAFLEITQLRVVEIVGHFLPVAGDERNSRSFVEKLHRGRDLARLDGQFGGDALYDLECYGFRHKVLVFLRTQSEAASA